MSSSIDSQDLSSYFLRNGKIDYQAVMQYARTLGHFLTSAEQAIYGAIIDRTARYADTGAYIRTEAFFTGTAPTADSAGVMPIPEMSANTFHRIKAKLCRLGLIAVDGLRYTIRLDATPLDLASDEEVQASMCKLHRHNPKLRTAEGLVEMATRLTETLLAFIAPQELDVVENEGDTSYSLDGNIYPSPSDKSEGCSSRVLKGIALMKRTAADILAAANSRALERRDRYRDKRAKRGTLADRLSAFQQGWQEGQRAGDPSRIPSRIVSRKDMRLIKDQILRPAEGTDTDPAEFAKWVTEHWGAIGAQYFSRSKKYPERPVLPWLIACLETYTEAYHNREYLDPDAAREGVTVAEQTKRRARTADDTAKRLQSTANELAVAQAEINDLRKALKEKGRASGTVRKPIALPDFDEAVTGYKRKRK